MKRLTNFIASTFLVNLLALTVVWSLAAPAHASPLASVLKGDPLLTAFVVATATGLMMLVSLLDWLEASCTSLPDTP